VIAGLSGGLLAFFWIVRPFGNFDFWMIGILGTVLIFDLPVCILILTSRPPVMTLAPPLPSAEERKPRRTVRQRPLLSDDEFHDRFYRNTEVPSHISIRLRKIYAIQLGLDRVRPDDKATDFDGEIDLADLFIDVADEFGVHFTEAEVDQMDGSFDSIVKCLAGKLDDSD